MNNNTNHQFTNDLLYKLQVENHAMVDFALTKGLELHEKINANLKHLEAYAENDTTPKEGRLIALSGMHHDLCELVAPAKPGSIVLIDQKQKYVFLGPVRLIQDLMIASIVSICAFILASTSSLVTVDNLNRGVFDEEPKVVLFNLLFLLSAAGIGGCFYGLFKANHFVANRTFDPKYTSSYWSRIVLGLIAGLILAELIPLGEGGEGLKKPALAIIGGFSVNNVYKVLTRIVKTIEMFVSPSEKDNTPLQKESEKRSNVS